MTISQSENETEKIGADTARKIKNLPALILLDGPVGSGKTCWVRGFVHEYIGHKVSVSSPTFSVIQFYKSKKSEVAHVDLYRIKGLDDLESIGFWELFDEQRIIIVEWAQILEELGQQLKAYTPRQFRFQIVDESTRKITTSSPSE